MDNSKWDKLEYEAMLSPESRAEDRARNDAQAALLVSFLEHINIMGNLGVCIILETPSGEVGLAAAASAGTAMHPDTPGTLKTNPSPESEGDGWNDGSD